MPIDWAALAASKLGRWLASILFTLLCLGGIYWLGGHNMKKTIEAKYAAAIVKSNKTLEKELADAARENDREFGLRQVLRTDNRKTFNDALIDYAGKKHGSKTDSTDCSNGISDDGLLLLNASIKASSGAGRRQDVGEVPRVK